jgi:hypothetical protein
MLRFCTTVISPPHLTGAQCAPYQTWLAGDALRSAAKWLGKIWSMFQDLDIPFAIILLAVWLNPTALNGFLFLNRAVDDWRVCPDHVRAGWAPRMWEQSKGRIVGGFHEFRGVKF